MAEKQKRDRETGKNENIAKKRYKKGDKNVTERET